MSLNITLTLPERVISRIDKDRGDINRSRYVLRLLEKAFQDSLQQSERVSDQLVVQTTEVDCQTLLESEPTHE